MDLILRGYHVNDPTWLYLSFLLIVAAYTQDWGMFLALMAVMIFIFGSIPFTDAMIVRYVDDRLRSRVAGMRLTVAFGISSAARFAPSAKENAEITMVRWKFSRVVSAKRPFSSFLSEKPIAWT